MEFLVAGVPLEYLIQAAYALVIVIFIGLFMLNNRKYWRRNRV